MKRKAIMILVLLTRSLSCLSFNPALSKQASLTPTVFRHLSLPFVRLHSTITKSPFSRNLERFDTTPEGADLSSDGNLERFETSPENADLSSDGKEKMAKAYNLSTVLFGFISILLLVCPDKTLTKRLATKIGGAAGFGLASGASYILAGANEEDRLTSDTFKRLNVGVFGFSVLGLAGFPGEAAFFRTAAPALVTSLFMLVTRIVGASVAYQGWTRGVVVSNSNSNSNLNSTTRVQALVEGMKSNLRGLKVKREDKKKSLFYRNCMLVVMFGMFNNFMGGIFDIRYKEALIKTPFDISLQWSAVSRLFLVSSMIYSLKDAAERDSLSGTTFIQMNYMVAIWALLVGIGQAVIPLGFNFQRVEMISISLLFFVKGYKGQLKKAGNTRINNI